MQTSRPSGPIKAFIFQHIGSILLLPPAPPPTGGEGPQGGCRAPGAAEPWRAGPGPGRLPQTKRPAPARSRAHPSFRVRCRHGLRGAEGPLVRNAASSTTSCRAAAPRCAPSRRSARGAAPGVCASNRRNRAPPGDVLRPSGAGGAAGGGAELRGSAVSPRWAAALRGRPRALCGTAAPPAGLPLPGAHGRRSAPALGSLSSESDTCRAELKDRYMGRITECSTHCSPT
ncbi:uncharacterized protein LOC116232292 [Phasianus colchicus]|uniref:uncharacterized protein LOC116232292 n=1 Tax=Phasianus colchicus TaxID=9054 RepID=UPI00129ED20B|nr:uncharacterized protein LOC116232292 [Phasianus colchicus]